MKIRGNTVAEILTAMILGSTLGLFILLATRSIKENMLGENISGHIELLQGKRER